MKHPWIAIVLVGFLGECCWAANVADDRQQAAAALKILEPWQKSHAEATERFLHVVVWTPSDREFPTGYKDRLSRMLLHIQNFYAEEMERSGFGPRTFGLQLDPQGGVVLHEVEGAQPTRHYAKKSGSEIRTECLPTLVKSGIDPSEATIAIFCNLATWDEEQLQFTHKSPYYAGGNYRSGTAWQLDSPELDTWNLPKTTPVIRDGEYGRISLGKHNSIFIGGMAHELGHAFGLPHVKERADEAVRGTALMGSGNRTYGDEVRGEGRGTFLTFAHALRLASHPLFCKRIESRKNKVNASLTDLEIRSDDQAIAVTGTIRGEPPIYGVVAYFDPEGNGDYNQTSAVAIPAADGRFALQSDALVAGKTGVLRLVPLHASGELDSAATLATMSYSYSIATDGTPDLEAVKVRLALAPIVAALRDRDNDRARRLAKAINHEAAAAIATALTDVSTPSQSPAEYQGASHAVSLTAFAPEAAEVGWSRPTYNRIPDSSLLLESAGVVFAKGIYAHPPAKHVYRLGGRWKTLQGKVGIAAGHSGTVRFEIHGDGKELWKSKTVSAGQLTPFEVDVSGIQQLQLITSPTDDGASSDWGLWLAPQLSAE